MGYIVILWEILVIFEELAIFVLYNYFILCEIQAKSIKYKLYNYKVGCKLNAFYLKYGLWYSILIINDKTI